MYRVLGYEVSIAAQKKRLDIAILLPSKMSALNRATAERFKNKRENITWSLNKIRLSPHKEYSSYRDEGDQRKEKLPYNNNRNP